MCYLPGARKEHICLMAAAMFSKTEKRLGPKFVTSLFSKTRRLRRDVDFVVQLQRILQWYCFSISTVTGLYCQVMIRVSKYLMKDLLEECSIFFACERKDLFCLQFCVRSFCQNDSQALKYFTTLVTDCLWILTKIFWTICNGSGESKRTSWGKANRIRMTCWNVCKFVIMWIVFWLVVVRTSFKTIKYRSPINKNFFHKYLAAIGLITYWNKKISREGGSWGGGVIIINFVVDTVSPGIFLFVII